MNISYSGEFAPAPAVPMRDKVEVLQRELSKLPQYEAPTEHIFHGGTYCRQVWRPADCVIVGKVHKKEHFYMVVFGTVRITDGDGATVEVTGPQLILSKPGTKRAVYAVTDALCMTIHRVESKTIEDVESELVEDDPNSMFTIGNKVKLSEIEVKS